MMKRDALTVIAMAVCLAFLLAATAEAFRRGGGSRGGRSFSRGGVAAGGGFSNRAASPSRQINRQPSRQVPARRDLERPTTRPAERPLTRPETQPADRGDWTDNRDDRQDWRDEARDDRQEHWNQAREDRQDFIEDEWDGHYYHGYRSYTIVWGGVQTSYIVTPPCDTTLLVNGATYYHCTSDWYQQATVSGDVVYVVVSPPPGY